MIVINQKNGCRYGHIKAKNVIFGALALVYCRLFFSSPAAGAKRQGLPYHIKILYYPVGASANPPGSIKWDSFNLSSTLNEFYFCTGNPAG